MKVKVYKVYPKNNPDIWYWVDAPSKRIAKWCGAAVLNNTYYGSLTANQVVAKRCKEEE